MYQSQQKTSSATGKNKKEFSFTDAQERALGLLSNKIFALLEGGSRSGKTFVIIWAIIIRALKYDGTDHLVTRQVLAHAKASLWMRTIPDVISLAFPKSMKVHYDKGNHILSFSNGSRLWLGGLDDKERTEKILGQEYSTIYLNEASQISYNSFSIAKTRLNPPDGVPPRFYIDYNPPSKKHWGYMVFHRGVDPLSLDPVAYPEDYGFMQMNPLDNVENLSEHYLKTLDSLSPDKKRRFKYGEYLDPTGTIYKEFNESMIINEDVDCSYYTVGIDLITYAAVLIGHLADHYYVLDEAGEEGMIASDLNREIEKKWGKYNYYGYIDWNLGEAGLREFPNCSMATKGQGSVQAGIDLIRKKMDSGKFHIHQRCYKTISAIEGYRRDEKGRIVKENDHYPDALRYGTFSSEGFGTGGAVDVL